MENLEEELRNIKGEKGKEQEIKEMKEEEKPPEGKVEKKFFGNL